MFASYLTVYSGNQLPPFYIGSSSVSKIQDGYHGSVGSEQYRDIWKLEQNKNPHLFKTTIIRQFSCRFAALNHEMKMLRLTDARSNPLYTNCQVGPKSFKPVCQAPVQKTYPKTFEGERQKFFDLRQLSPILNDLF